jgi:rhodanese-related sulfurtransferase
MSGNSSSSIRDLVRLSLIALTALLLGILQNSFCKKSINFYGPRESTMQSWSEGLDATKDEEKKEGASLPQEVGLLYVREYVQRNAGYIIDARNAIFFDNGHIPGAINIPRNIPKLNEKLSSVATSARSQIPIVIYCSSSLCEDSKVLKSRLASEGFQNVAIMTEGWSGWKKAGFQIEVDS